MNEAQLQKIQDELLSSIDNDLDREQHVIAMAKEIAAKLVLGGPVKEEIEDRVLVFNYKMYQANGMQKLFMTVANPFMFEVGREKYKPYMLDVEIDNDMSMHENLSAIVEAFLRHIFDMVKAEEL